MVSTTLTHTHVCGHRLDAMQRKLVKQIETGFQALQEELDEAKERLRIATEKLYQQVINICSTLCGLAMSMPSHIDAVCVLR
jgi:hypothetical protein